MKIIVTCILFFAICINGKAQDNLKESIAIIRPVYDAKTNAFFSSLSHTLLRNGYITSSKVFKNYANGGFGSGFIVEGSPGKFYVLSNQHVVAQAKRANVDFIRESGDTIRYENCLVVNASDSLDLALIALPEGAKMTEALPLSGKKLNDGDDVWSAGYPGLDGKPSWQLGKGIVSNKGLKNNELYDLPLTAFIQHTAQVDPGSSGGPLLKHAGSNSGKYEVIGVNTWKAAGRENTNFALPASIVRDFITQALEQKKVPDPDNAKTQAEKFAATAKGNYKDVKKFISNTYISQITSESFEGMLSQMSKEAEAEVVKLLREGDPIEAFRSLIADAIVCKVRKSNESLKVVDLGSSLSASGQEQISLSFGEKNYASSWENEQGHWKIADLSLLSVSKVQVKSGLAYEYNSAGSLWIGTHFPQNNNQGNRYEIGYEGLYSSYFGYHMAIFYGEERWIDPNDQEEKTEAILGPEFGLGGQLPLRVSSVYLIPYVKGLLGLNFGEHSFFYTGARGGLRLCFSVSKNKLLFVGGEYKYTIPLGDRNKDGFKLSNIPSIGVTLGLYY